MSAGAAIEALIDRAHRTHQSGQYPEAWQLATQARREARDAGLRGLELIAQVQAACSQSARNPPSTRLAPFEPVLATVAEGTLGELMARPDVGASIVRAYAQWGRGACEIPWVDVSEILEVLEQGDAFVDEYGGPRWRASLRHVRATVLRAHGRRAEAIPHAQEAFALCPCPSFCSSLAEMLQDEGRLEEAWSHYVWVLDHDREDHGDHVYIGILLSLEQLARTEARREELRGIATEQARRMGYEDPEDPRLPPLLKSLMGRGPQL